MMSKENYKILIDESAPKTYIGYAARGTATTLETWRIILVDETTNPASVTFPEKNDDFVFKWDDRATYVYG